MSERVLEASGTGAEAVRRVVAWRGVDGHLAEAEIGGHWSEAGVEMAHVLLVVLFVHFGGGAEEALHLLHLTEKAEEGGGDADELLEWDLLSHWPGAESKNNRIHKHKSDKSYKDEPWWKHAPRMEMIGESFGWLRCFGLLFEE